MEEDDEAEKRSIVRERMGKEYVYTVNVLHEVKPLRADFMVLVEFEDQILPSPLAGSTGAVSGLSNVVPKLFVNLVRSGREGELRTAAQLHRCILSLMALAAHSAPPIGAINLVVTKLGVPISPAVRGPALLTPAESEEAIDAALHTAGLLPVGRKA
jgi:dihydrodipicolinate synthase/N-acetylneuraminate lyase